MPREERVHDLRHDRVFVAEYATKEWSAALQALNQVAANFIFDGRQPPAGVGRVAERSQSFW